MHDSKANDVEIMDVTKLHERPKNENEEYSPSSSNGPIESHGAPEVTMQNVTQESTTTENVGAGSEDSARKNTFMDKIKIRRGDLFAYVKTKEFWIVLALG